MILHDMVTPVEVDGAVLEPFPGWPRRIVRKENHSRMQNFEDTSALFLDGKMICGQDLFCLISSNQWHGWMVMD